MRLYTYEEDIEWGPLPHGIHPTWVKGADTIRVSDTGRFTESLSRSGFYRDVEVGVPFLRGNSMVSTISYEMYSEATYVDVETLGEAHNLLTSNPQLALCWDGKTLILDESPITVNLRENAQ